MEHETEQHVSTWELPGRSSLRGWQKRSKRWLSVMGLTTQDRNIGHPPMFILRASHRLHARCTPTPLDDTLESPDGCPKCLLPYTANTSLISFSITRSAASMPYVLAIAWMSLE